jgi:hypothetical protein
MATLAYDRLVKEMRVQDPDISAEVVEVYSQSRDYEARLTNMDLPSLVAGAGKEPLGQILGGNVFVGITMILTDGWLVGWADQAGPSTVTREIRGGNTLGQVEPQGEPNPTLQVPVAPTTFATVVISQSSSATLVEPGFQSDIHGQMERRIYVDTSALTNGNGYQQSPYNNFTDAVDDAEAANIKHLVLLADATADRQLRNFHFIGIGNPALDINGQDIDRSEFENLELDGTMVAANGIIGRNITIRNNVAGLNGRFYECGLAGDITLANNANFLYIDGWSALGGAGQRPSITLGTGGSNVSVRSYRGGLNVAGIANAADTVSVSMAQGKLSILSSCTDGDISVRGTAQFVDDSGAGVQVDDSALLQPIRLSDAWQLLGLDAANPLVVTKTSQVAGDVNQTIGGDGENTSTVTRNP